MTKDSDVTVTTKEVGGELPAHVALKAMDIHEAFNKNGLTLDERARILYAMSNNVTNKSFMAENELADLLVDMGTGAAARGKFNLDKVDELAKRILDLEVVTEAVEHLEAMYQDQSVTVISENPDDEEE